jgi:hypothetical protein
LGNDGHGRARIATYLRNDLANTGLRSLDANNRQKENFAGQMTVHQEKEKRTGLPA